jgi:hypothetical protein
MQPIANLADAIAAAEELGPEFENDVAWWRGHANAAWPLQAQVHRPNPNDPKKRPYSERELIGHFVSRAPSRSHRPCPADDDYIRWLFLAQHYGLPTRLLDWSENLLVAIFFAVTEHPDDDGCIWALWPTGLNLAFKAADGLVTIGDSRVAKIARKAFTGKKSSMEIIAIDGQEIDPRMLAQTSKFTLHSYNVRLDSLPDNERWLRKCVIARSAKAKIREQLSLVGVRRWNLFPDLQHLADDLKTRRFG